MNYLDDLKKHKEIIILMVGVVFILAGCLLGACSNQKDFCWVTNAGVNFLISIGGVCFSTSFYDLMMKKISEEEKKRMSDIINTTSEKIKNDFSELLTSFEKLKREYFKPEKAISEYENNKTTTHVLYDKNDFTEFINIGKFDDVIKENFTFKNLIEQDKYKGRTVWIIGTDFKVLQDNKEIQESFKEALLKGVSFKIVLTDPDSVYLPNDDNTSSDTIGLITNIINIIIRDNPTYKGGSIELRLHPFVERLHSFSLFETVDSRIATLDFSFGSEQRFSQMFFDGNNKKNEMMNNLIEYYQTKFSNSIPHFMFPVDEEITINLYLKQNEKIILKKNGEEIAEEIAEVVPSFKYKKENTIDQLILTELFIQTNNNQVNQDKKPFQLLKAFESDKTISVVGEIQNEQMVHYENEQMVHYENEQMVHYELNKNYHFSLAWKNLVRKNNYTVYKYLETIN